MSSLDVLMNLLDGSCSGLRYIPTDVTSSCNNGPCQLSVELDFRPIWSEWTWQRHNVTYVNFYGNQACSRKKYRLNRLMSGIICDIKDLFTCLHKQVSGITLYLF